MTSGIATTQNASPVGFINNATITATYSHPTGTVSNTTLITPVIAVPVSLSITRPSATLSRGQSENLLAIATYSNGTTQDVTTDPGINWSSASADVSVGTTTGVATSANNALIGTAVTITATYTSSAPLLTATTTITPVAAVAVSLSITRPSAT